MKPRDTQQLKALGKRIDELIKNKGLKVMNVAHDANLDSTNLRKYIRGSQDMRYSTLLRISKAIGITPWELLQGIVETEKEG